MTSFLGQIGRCKVDRDPLPGKRQADGGERRAHPLPAFTNGLVGKPHQIELTAPRVGDVDLDIHFACFDALEGNGVDMGDGHESGRTIPAAAPAISMRAR